MLIVDAAQDVLEQLIATLEGWEYTTGSRVGLPAEDGRSRATTRRC
ncbi:hypothetical protein [Streptomyces canus]